LHADIERLYAKELLIPFAMTPTLKRNNIQPVSILDINVSVRQDVDTALLRVVKSIPYHFFKSKFIGLVI